MRKSTAPKEIKYVGDYILSKRLEYKMTLKQVSKGSGLSEGYISRIENNIQTPSYESALSIISFMSPYNNGYNKDVLPFLEWMVKAKIDLALSSMKRYGHEIQMER